MKKKFVENLFVRFMRYCVLWSEHREAIKALNMLSDKELRDIGINRADIDRMVWLDIDKANRGNKNNEK